MSESTSGASPTSATVDVPVRGMHCSACAQNIERALQKLPGVAGAAVNFATARASVAGGAPIREIVAGVRAAGYDVGTRTTRLDGGGAKAAESVLALDGVLEARSVEGGLEVVHVDVEGLAATVLDVARVATGGGAIEARIEDDEGDPERTAREREIRLWRTRFVVGAAVFVPLMLATTPGTMHAVPHVLADPRVQLVLALPVQFVVGWPFLRGAWASIKRRSADMDTLIAMGTLAAFLYSAAATFLPSLFEGEGLTRDVYFDTSVAIVTLICLGRWLEERAKGRAGSSGPRVRGGTPVISRPSSSWSRNAASCPFSRALRWEVFPWRSPALCVVITSITVGAEPSCRYGPVAHIPFKVGVSRPRKVSCSLFPDPGCKVPTSCSRNPSRVEKSEPGSVAGRAGKRLSV